MTAKTFSRQIGPLARLTCAVLATSVAGCALKRDNYDVPPVPLPETFLNQGLNQGPTAGSDGTAGATDAAAAAGTADKASPVNPDPTTPPVTAETPQTPLAEVLPQWWRLFGSSELDVLIDRALRRNHDLQMSTLRVEQAQARFKQAAADELPTLTAPVSAAVDAPPNGLGSVSKGGDVVSERSFRLGLRTDWRVDLWGERAAAADAARQALWQATYDRDNVRRLVVGQVVTAYFQYLSLNDRYRVAQETETSQTDMLGSVEQRYTEGEATGIEMQQQRAAVRSSRATLPTLDLQRAETRHRLAVLVGMTPSELTLSDSGLDSVTVPGVVPGVPSSLLLRRPDVRSAESALLLADANIDEARARILPSLDLSAGAGTGANRISELFQPYSLMWNGLASLTATIFDYGKRQRQIDYARARHQELVESYVRAIYQAVRDVEDALAGVHFNALRLKAQTEALEASKAAWDFSRESYRVGATDYQTMLDTERTFRSDQDSFHRDRLDRVQSTVSLFLSLGGGTGDDLPLPGSGKRPPLPDTKQSGVVLASAPAAQETKAINWTEDASPRGWSVTLAAVFDRAGVDAAWRDLKAQLGNAADGLTAYPQQLGQVVGEKDGTLKDRMTWFRLRVSGLTTEDAAKTLCGQLGKDGRACTVSEE
ncbi:efflux transporter outer membrane subunit [Novispirillum itersonii]|uniref:NodT family efflux transporter outer membrane factor (OMF) lipoprotein n=1 Tax=Novispirillum itersonii TaxID=189 RepID=A0A7W9ZJ55_NOVIT|nr:efflux transporter outer membrane subunit [Novispirillum itersonii]MBB6212455.1 NodT family efflux transporter outer membrane factor (OMF) lipoprotein [Novispirillum itersonii]